MSNTGNNNPGVPAPAQPNTFVFNRISQWSIVGLDPTDSVFSELYLKESTFETSKVKFDLAPETFQDFTNNLIEKVERIQAVAECQVAITTNTTKYVLKEYSSISTAQMKVARELRWPDRAPRAITDQASANRFTDSQIKSSVLGTYIHESLTETAKEQLNADSHLFKVTDLSGNKYLDGPSYFHCIARLVNPNNRRLVSQTKMSLRSLEVKKFGYDVKKMLAEFRKLRKRVADLGGKYSIDDQFLDLWTCVGTMKEKEFTRFVSELEDKEATKDKQARASIDEIIRQITAKQTRMESDKEWNVMSHED